VIHGDAVILQCDVQGKSFLASFALKDGTLRWKKARDEVPTWGTPTVYRTGDRVRIAVNGYKHIGGYDFETGEEVWRMKGGGDIPVPTPVFAHGHLFITSAHGRMSPIYAVRATAEGDITLEADTADSEHVAWWIRRGGNYMQTPLVHGDLLFACRDSGVLSCFIARTGERLFQERIGERGEGFTASPVAAGGNLYFASERGNVHVIRAGRTFERIARNVLGEPCMATPAVSGGVLFVRARRHLFALGKK
jgi:outer membrane protein assembly factor BamB